MTLRASFCESQVPNSGTRAHGSCRTRLLPPDLTGLVTLGHSLGWFLPLPVTRTGASPTEACTQVTWGPQWHADSDLGGVGKAWDSAGLNCTQETLL